MHTPAPEIIQNNYILRKTRSVSRRERDTWKRRGTETDLPEIVGTSLREQAHAMPMLSRLYGQRSFYGLSEREWRDGFQRVALSELWKHHRPRHCHLSPVGSERSCEIEAALVGSRSYAYINSVGGEAERLRRRTFKITWAKRFICPARPPE